VKAYSEGRSVQYTRVFAAGPSPGYSSRKIRRRGQKPAGGAHFKNIVLDVCNNQGAKCEMGGTDFKWGGRAPLALPLVTALVC